MTGSKAPPATKSGEHKAVKRYREKLESMEENTLEELLALNRELEAEIKIVPPPATDDTEPDTPVAPKDPRRDGTSIPPVDRVEFPTVPAPKPEKK